MLPSTMPPMVPPDNEEPPLRPPVEVAIAAACETLDVVDAAVFEAAEVEEPETGALRRLAAWMWQRTVL